MDAVIIADCRLPIDVLLPHCRIGNRQLAIGNALTC